MGLTCNQKLVETSLIYRTELKQNRKCWKNSQQPESIVLVQENQQKVVVAGKFN